MTANRKNGTREWSEHSANLFLGCEHDCRYCYARCSALRFKRIRFEDEWKKPISLHRCPKFARRVQGVIMFPTTHDVTPSNVHECEAYLESMLRYGNRVLVVSKMSPTVAYCLARRLAEWRAQLEFRVTVGTPCESTRRYWEPGAPSYGDRMEAAEALKERGFTVSFSVEPLLCRLPQLKEMVEDMLPTADSIWIGKLNKLRQRVRIETAEDEREAEWIERGQTDERVMEIVQAFLGDTVIRWKDSIREVMERCGMSS